MSDAYKCDQCEEMKPGRPLYELQRHVVRVGYRGHLEFCSGRCVKKYVDEEVETDE